MFAEQRVMQLASAWEVRSFSPCFCRSSAPGSMVLVRKRYGFFLTPQFRTRSDKTCFVFRLFIQFGMCSSSSTTWATTRLNRRRNFEKAFCADYTLLRAIFTARCDRILCRRLARRLYLSGCHWPARCSSMPANRRELASPVRNSTFGLISQTLHSSTA